MSWDPRVLALLEAQKEVFGGRFIAEVPIDELRNLFEKHAPVGEPAVRSIEDRTIEGPVVSIDLRIYRPQGEASPAPALIWIHGGGWSIGGLTTADASARMMCNAGGCVVISVDHRHAPEDPYPAAFDDVYAAAEWIVANAGELGLDLARIAIGGESSGANLAAAVCLAARDRNGPTLAAQLLVIPALEYDMARPSAQADNYLAGGDQDDPYAVPIKANSVAGLPPALLLVGEYDPMCDGALAYGARLTESGVDATCKRYESAGHKLFDLPFGPGPTSVADAGAWLREVLT
jgi:acetyl esterase